MLITLVVSVALWPGTSIEKPGCAKPIRGQMWPLEANRDPGLANRLAREGLLEICTHTAWRYKEVLAKLATIFER